VLARAAVEIAQAVEAGVFQDRHRADRLLAAALRRRRDLAPPDARLISRVVFALFRWRGWIEPLGPRPMALRLLLATLLDAPVVPPACRIWAREAGFDPSSLFALGDAPTWKARSEGFRRLLRGQAVTADPWRLFPPWLREHLPLPPGGGSAKTRFVELLQVLQTAAPLWVRAQAPDPPALWDKLRHVGIKPWVHRRVVAAAQLGPDVDVYHLPAFERGELEIQDLASQAVAIVCDPDPGERWWDACAGAGGKALHLATLMQGKGVVVATDVHESKLKETVRRARRSPWRNLTTRRWDGKHVAGKPASYDGVLVDAPCSAIGTWRRNPDARWLLDREAVARLAQQQRTILAAASAGVKVGGTLVYSVCTLTPSETVSVVGSFLESHPGFRLDPYPHPLTGAATDGQLLIWPQDANTDGMFIARMVRTA
jgi:16S rRNA (cytosine967-C5)-methyltransferase